MDNLLNILLPFAFSAFFSGMESAYLSINKRRYVLDKKDKGLTDCIMDFFFQNPDSFMTTMLIGNCVALVIFSLQIATGLAPWLEYIKIDGLAFLVQVVLVILIVWSISEFVPRILFRINSRFLLRFFAIPLYLIYIVLFPISKLISLLSWAVLYFVGVKNLSALSIYPLEKVSMGNFLRQKNKDDVSEKTEMDTEVKIFQNALDFSKVRLRDCMIPRTEIVACDKNSSIDELRSRFIETGLSKILIYNENMDDIIGYIHSSELFKRPEDWTLKIRKVPIVPETMAANKLMRDLMQEKKSLAVVVDEFGGISGIVTLEDLVEEIFGEIEDEHDVKRRITKKIANNEYLVSGRTEIDALNEMFGLDLPESDDYVTVAGFILHFYQKFPKVNETIVYGKYAFKIIKVTATKIELVRMKVSQS